VTTIAVTKDEIGCDLQYTEGTHKWKGAPKVIYFEPHELTYPVCPFYIGFSGSANDIVGVAEFFSRPESTKAPRVKDLKGAVLTAKGDIFVFDHYAKWIKMAEAYYAVGSGAHYALGALGSGASVKDAIKIASKKDPFTGMGVRTFKF
jgi:hypothetical protein